MKLITGKKIIVALPAVLVLFALAFLISTASAGDERVITGIVESKEIDVSSKIAGRIDKIFADEGTMIKKGDLLAQLENKEMKAKVEQAKGLMDAAKAKLMMAKNGARPEEKEQAEKIYLQAKHQFEFASKSWKRIESLYKDKVVSEHERDEMEFKFNAAKEQYEAAKARYEMILKGARYEEIAAAEALYHQAENGYKEATAYYEELSIISPCDGVVVSRIADEGEIINSGYPVFTILPENEAYAIIQVREDQLNGIRTGRILKGKIPALGNSEHKFEVKNISAMGDFATWKPTNQKGDFDLKTFEIHLYPVSPIKELRPGMTLNFNIE